MGADLNEIAELELFFASVDLPLSQQLDPGTTICDVPKFIKDNIDTLRTPGVADLAVSTRMYRLRRLKEILSSS